MTGEMDLRHLVATMTPELQPGRFVFATVSDPHPEVWRHALMTFRESEGLTAIVDETISERLRLTTTFRCRCITLSVHSSLDAVGFLAVVTRALARAGIGVNPVSACFHDHLFVADDKAEAALSVLQGLADSGSDGESLECLWPPVP
ncbi:ACT domain-containing protein [Microvirga rosea]|nr:ACT domain-containing protein [Microvirga rosea]